jgi:hypothetical protein
MEFIKSRVANSPTIAVLNSNLGICVRRNESLKGEKCVLLRAAGF